MIDLVAVLLYGVATLLNLWAWWRWRQAYWRAMEHLKLIEQANAALLDALRRVKSCPLCGPEPEGGGR